MKSKQEDRLSIWKVMEALDKKDYGFYDSLTDDEKKKFSPYLIFKWASTVEGNNDISKFYALSMNEYVNVDFWECSKNKKLTWLSLCAASPGIGRQKHYWLGNGNKNDNKLKTSLRELLPLMKESDIDVILKINSEKEIVEWMKHQNVEDDQKK